MGGLTSPFPSRHSYVLGDIDIKYSITYKFSEDMDFGYRLRSNYSIFKCYLNQPHVTNLVPRFSLLPLSHTLSGRSHAVLPEGGGRRARNNAWLRPEHTDVGPWGESKGNKGVGGEKIYYFSFCFLLSPSVVSFLRSSAKLTTLWVAILAFPNLPLW